MEANKLKKDTAKLKPMSVKVSINTKAFEDQLKVCKKELIKLSKTKITFD